MNANDSDQQIHNQEEERDHRTKPQEGSLFALATSLARAHVEVTRAAMDTDPVPMMGVHGYSFASLKEVVEHLNLEDFTEGELNQMGVLGSRLMSTARNRRVAAHKEAQAKIFADLPVKLTNPNHNPYYANGRDSEGRYMGD